MKKNTLISLFTLFNALTFASGAAHADSGKVSVLVSLTPAGTFTAVSDKLKGDLIKTGANFTADKLTVMIESFKTTISLRDEHYWKHLNSTKFPKATLTDLKATGGKATAQLEVNGVKKPITLTYVEKGTEISATAFLKSSDFNLPKASYLGVGVKDDVKLDVVAPFTVKK